MAVKSVCCQSGRGKIADRKSFATMCWLPFNQHVNCTA